MPYIDDEDILFIINPNSGGINGLKVIREIESFSLKLSFVVTKNLTEFDNTFKTNIDKYKVFIVVGGDGTVNSALPYLFDRKDKVLGIIPAGSGNGFAKELGFKKSVSSLMNDIRRGQTVAIDVLSLNNNKCINVAGIGFDSYVAHSFATSKKRGFKNYIYHTVKAVYSFTPIHATLKIDNTIIQDKLQMISIANTRQFGNNAIIAPQAKPNDGIFDLITVKPFPFYLYPQFVVKLFLGKLKDSKYVTFIRVREIVELESDFKKYHIDGEPKSFNDKLCIKMLKGKIRVIKTANNKV